MKYPAPELSFTVNAMVLFSPQQASKQRQTLQPIVGMTLIIFSSNIKVPSVACALTLTFHWPYLLINRFVVWVSNRLEFRQDWLPTRQSFIDALTGNTSAYICSVLPV